MKRRERILLAIAIAYGLCCGCSRTKEVREEEHAEVHEQVQASIEEHVVETSHSGPETITSTVEEFATIEPLGTSALAQEGQSAPVERSLSKREVAGSTPASGPLPGILVKRTVTVDQRGAVDAAKTAEAKGASTAALAARGEKRGELKEEEKAGPDWIFWLSVGAGGVVAIGIAWKFGLLAKAWGSI